LMELVNRIYSFLLLMRDRGIILVVVYLKRLAVGYQLCLSPLL